MVGAASCHSRLRPAPEKRLVPRKRNRGCSGNECRLLGVCSGFLIKNTDLLLRIQIYLTSD
jgi:hypothetical protein